MPIFERYNSIQCLPKAITDKDKWDFCLELERVISYKTPSVAVYPSVQLTSIIDPESSMIPGRIKSSCYYGVCDWVVIDYGVKPLTVAVLIAENNPLQNEILEISSIFNIPCRVISYPYGDSVDFVANSLKKEAGKREFLHDKEIEVFEMLEDIHISRENIYLIPQVNTNSLFSINRHEMDYALTGKAISPETDFSLRCKGFKWDITEQIEHIKRSSVDFVLAHDMKGVPIALLAIEFDGRHHKETYNQKKDCMKDDVFQCADLPLLRISSSQWSCDTETSKIKKLMKNINKKFFKYLVNVLLITTSIFDDEMSRYGAANNISAAEELISAVVSDMLCGLYDSGFSSVKWEIRSNGYEGRKIVIINGVDPKGRIFRRESPSIKLSGVGVGWLNFSNIHNDILKGFVLQSIEEDYDLRLLPGV